MGAPLRLAAIADLDRLAGLMAAFYAEEGYPLDLEAAREALRGLIQEPAHGRVWLILDGGEPVGYVALTLGYALEYYGRDAFLDDLYIQAVHRGQGLGTAALEEVERTCRVLGVRALHLEVERDNAVAQAIYRRRGFRDNHRQPLTKRMGPF